MKSWLIVGIMALAGTSAAQVKLQITRDGKNVGVATVTQKMRQDGSKQVQMSMESASTAGTITFRSESIYQASGMPQRKYQEIAIPGQKFRRTIIAEFSEKSVRVTTDNNGTRTVKDVPLPKNASAADKSEFWFVRDKPAAGAKVSGYTFNLEKLEWETVTTTFVGQVEITIGTTKVKANKTQSDRGVAFVDDQGMPLRLELPNGLMERILK
jgi:hypothetical protein